MASSADLPPAKPDRQIFLEGLIAQGRVIGALLLREVLTRYGRRNIGFLWMFVEPALFVLTITAVWVFIRQIHRSDIPIAAFALTGYSAVFMWRSMPQRCFNAVRSNRQLMFHRQVKMLDVYLARILLEFMGFSMSFIAVGTGFWAAGVIDPPEDMLKVLVGWFLLGWFGMGLALVLGVLSERIAAIQRLWVPVSLVIMPLSGIAFIVDALPPRAREIVLYMPQVNALEYLRDGFFGSLFVAHYDIGYVVAFNMVLSLVGIGMVRSMVVTGEDVS